MCAIRKVSITVKQPPTIPQNTGNYVSENLNKSHEGMGGSAPAVYCLLFTFIFEVMSLIIVKA